MRLKKRFVAWLLAAVMVVSPVQFLVSHVHAGEIQTDEVVAETNEKETENAGDRKSTRLNSSHIH